MTEQLKIERGIPMPPPNSVTVTGQLRAMEVGDSFLTTRKASGFNQRFKDLRPMKFTTRTVEGGIRVWRVA